VNDHPQANERINSHVKERRRRAMVLKVGEQS
jgi:hypothetical protein